MREITEGLKVTQNISWIFLCKKLLSTQLIRYLIWLQLTFKRELFSLSTWSPNFSQFLSCNVKTLPALLPVKATVQCSILNKYLCKYVHRHTYVLRQFEVHIRERSVSAETIVKVSWNSKFCTADENLDFQLFFKVWIYFFWERWK